MKSSLSSLFKVMGSNFIVMVLGIITTLTFPRFLGPEEYGEYQLYIFYASFLGLFLLGYCDGIYLRYGGIDYKELNKAKLGGDFLFLILYLTVVCFLFSAVVTKLGFLDRKLVNLLTVTLFIQNLNSFFVLVNQASGRFNVYSITNVIEKFILSLYAVVIFLFQNITLDFLFSMVVLGKFLTLTINMSFDRSIVKKMNINKINAYEVKENILAGLPLTISGIISMLITGVGRNLVDRQLGKTQFGIYSLVFSMMSIITQVISAISIVFYPILKNVDEKNHSRNLIIVDDLLKYIGLVVYFSAYPIYFIIVFFLKKYVGAIDSLFILLPTLVSQARITMLYNTYYKVLRKERIILINGIFTLLISIVLTFIFFFFSASIESVAIATLISFLFWENLSKINLYKVLNILLDKKQIFFNPVISLSFVFLNLFLRPIEAFFIFLIITFLIFLKEKEKISLYFTFIKNGG